MEDDLLCAEAQVAAVYGRIGVKKQPDSIASWNRYEVSLRKLRRFGTQRRAGPAHPNWPGVRGSAQPRRRFAAFIEACGAV